MNFVYIIECHDKTLYTGWTNNLEKRMEAHNAGTASKYTRMRRPVILRYLESFDEKRDAQKREHAIKLLSRKQKLVLIGTDQN